MASKDFVEITAVKQVRMALKATQEFRFPVLVVGDAGLGKSTALLNIAEENRFPYGESSERVKKATALYKFLLEMLGEGAIKKESWDLYQQCQIHLSRLKDDECVIIDEYQNMPPTMIREVLHFQDHFRFPLILSGNRERLARTGNTAGALDQIESRIGMTFRVGRPDYNDCMNIGVEYNVEGIEAYDALARFGAAKSVRQLVLLLQTATKITGGRGSIKLPELLAAARALANIPDAVKLLKGNSNT